MIFVNHMKSAKAAKDYFTQHIAPGDGRYYANDAAEMKGTWHGRAAEMTKLAGEVTQQWNARPFLYQLGTIKLVVRGAFDGTRQEAYGRADCEPAAAG